MNSDSEDSGSLAPKPPRSKALLAWMIVSQTLASLSILIGTVIGVFGFFRDGKMSFAHFIFLSPLLMLIPLVASWFAYTKGRQKLAWILTSIPILYVCLEVAAMAGLLYFMNSIVF